MCGPFTSKLARNDFKSKDIGMAEKSSQAQIFFGLLALLPQTAMIDCFGERRDFGSVVKVRHSGIWYGMLL